MENNKPKLIIFAGPNGSGKSTVTNMIFDKENFIGSYINADEIMKNEKITDKEAFYKAEELRQLALKNKESFAMETVFSHESKLELMREAKKLGYEVSLIFVTTFDKEINVRRVAGRVKEGGHDVPIDKIRARYDRVMAFMSEAISIADKSVVFNNSLDKPVAILRKYKDGKIKIYPQKEPSEWNKEKLEKIVYEINKLTNGAWTNIPKKKIKDLNNLVKESGPSMFESKKSEKNNRMKGR